MREADTGFWVLDESYRLPALEGTPAARPGYDVSWTLDGQPHTAGVTVSHPLLLEEQGSREGDI